MLNTSALVYVETTLSLSLSLSFYLAPHVSVSVAAEQSLLNVEEVCRL